LATTQTYNKDVAFYDTFGPAPFREWIAKIRADEARHFGGAMRLIRTLHRHRLGEIDSVLDRIVEIEHSATSYQGTFVLDHTPDCTHFLLSSDELERDCIQIIREKARRWRTTGKVDHAHP
jgi:hypothetical protein